jgi:excisionase family DNA binding protein
MSQQTNSARFPLDHLPDTKIFISVNEAATRLSCGITLIYEHIGKGSFRTVKLGKKRLVDLASLTEFAAALSNQSGKAKQSCINL